MIMPRQQPSVSRRGDSGRRPRGIIRESALYCRGDRSAIRPAGPDAAGFGGAARIVLRRFGQSPVCRQRCWRHHENLRWHDVSASRYPRFLRLKANEHLAILTIVSEASKALCTDEARTFTGRADFCRASALNRSRCRNDVPASESMG